MNEPKQHHPDVPLDLPQVLEYRSFAELQPLAPELDALNLASRRPSPFDTFAYLQTFAAHDEFHTPDEEMLFLVARDETGLLGWLALRMIHEGLLGVRHTTIRFLMTHDNDRPRVIARPEDEARCAAAFYRYLFEEVRYFSVLIFDEQDAASPLCTPPPWLDLHRYYLRTFPTNPNGTIELGYPSLAAYLQHFNHDHRHKLTSGVRKLASLGALELVMSSDPRALPALFDLYLALEQRSWKAQVGGHVGRHPARVAFFRRLMEADQPMKIVIHLLLLDGAPIAGAISGAFEGARYGLEIAFDEAYAHVSPGNTLTLLMMWDAMEQRYRFANQLGNYAYFKAAWGATITETNAVQIFKKGSLPYFKAKAGELERRILPPVSPYDLDHNLDREKARGPAEARADRGPERERTSAVLATIEASGAHLTRMDLPAIAKVLPFDVTGKGNKGKKGAQRTEVRP